jgi:hypothetical protein
MRRDLLPGCLASVPDVTPEEEDFGFGLREGPSGIQAVVRELRPGLQAVKVESADGATEYVICDEHFEPIYSSATSLDELHKRFGSPPT